MSTQRGTCATTAADLPFYAYGELPGESEERLEQHCAECASCAALLAGHRRMLQALDRARVEEPPQLLGECRHQLSLAIAAGSAARREAPAVHHGWLTRQIRSLMDSSIAFRVPVGAMALVAVGFFGAKLAPELGSRASQAGLLNVRSVQTDSSGKVQIAVDDTRRQTVSGSIDDPHIRQLLIGVLQDEANPGVRVETADMLKDHCALADVRSALTDPLLNDPNPGVRLKAMEGLKRFSSDPAVRKTLTTVLMNDSNPGVRIQAIDLLTATKDRSIVGVLQTVMQKEDNRYVRLKTRSALEDMRASVGTF